MKPTATMFCAAAVLMPTFQTLAVCAAVITSKAAKRLRLSTLKARMKPIMIGISLGTALLKTNAAAWLANLIVLHLGLEHASAFAILMLMSLFLVVIHLGFASATALASAMVPIIISVLLAVKTPGINVVGMTMLLQFVVSFGFILPVNAPQNMIAYGTGTFDARDFVKTGLAITAVAGALLVVFAMTYWSWMGYMSPPG